MKSIQSFGQDLPKAYGSSTFKVVTRLGGIVLLVDLVMIIELALTSSNGRHLAWWELLLAMASLVYWVFMWIYLAVLVHHGGSQGEQTGS